MFDDLPWWYENEEGDALCEKCAEEYDGEVDHIRPGNDDYCSECGRWQGENFNEEE